MTSDELYKLFKEICIRFDTDPKRYSKFDFGLLIKYLKEQSVAAGGLLESIHAANVDINLLKQLLNSLKEEIQNQNIAIDNLENSDSQIIEKIENLKTLLSTLNDNVEQNKLNLETVKQDVNELNSHISSANDKIEDLEKVIYPIEDNFLDKRQSIANSEEDLKNWDFKKYPIPNGFEVCLNGIWYKYETDRENTITGHFFKRTYTEDDNLSIPVIDQNIIDTLPNDQIPEKYIFIPTQNEFTPKKDGVDLVTGQDNSYLQIIFAALKSLQAQVTRLQNSFEYGIQSYKDKNTAMSREADSEQKEPLWAIDENNLKELIEISPDLSTNTDQFNPVNGVQSLGNNTLKFIDNQEVYWQNNFSIYDDPKLFAYLTTEGYDNYSGKDISIQLLPIDSEEENIQIDISNFPIINHQKYNIFVLISRKQKISNTYKGYNYIYISITDYITDTTVLEGYYNPVNNTISESPIYLDARYTYDQFKFQNLILSKFKLYSKEEDFSNQIIPSKPNISDYKNEVAHITIRSVAESAVIDQINNQLLTDELVWSRKEKKLYIIQEGQKIAIGAATSGGEITTDDMTTSELIELLYKAGIIKASDSGEGNWIYEGLKPLSGITFINDETGKQKTFDISVDAYGALRSKEVTSENTIEDKLNKYEAVLMNEYSDSDTTKLNYNIRGTIGQLAYGAAGSGISYDKDQKLFADRIKIGAFYAPYKSDVDSKICGCSHAYIELENTSDKDFKLDKFYLYFMHYIEDIGEYKVEKLALDGVLKAGSTYLIRGKQYVPYNDSNCFIKVNTYDQEWFTEDGLVDLQISSNKPYGLALVYDKPDLDINYKLVKKNTAEDTYTYGTLVLKNTTSYPYGYATCYVDSVYYSNQTATSDRYYKDELTNTFCWAPAGIYIENNSIYKNTFELDPAKQAFQGLTTVDSSRARNAKLDNQDAMIVRLWNEKITFPHSDYEYPVSMFTPKASFENKNVSTDKSKLDRNKPNMVTCSFGINIYKTRTFNWISCGSFDEFVWLKVGDTWIPFESYKQTDVVEQSSTYPRRREFAKEIHDPIYSRISGRFPGDGTFFTSHKCIIDVVDTSVVTPTTYEYKIARKDKSGNIDLSYSSDSYYFTLYPESYNPQIYQITDQQGFHWMEYQVWNASAKVINDQINEDIQQKNIIPILVNTGDMTQNGTRINEWLDYYNGGIDLFRHLEQVNVVGNNDLCNYDPWILGTGDDAGKSNSFYFHLFYCYEINVNNILPLINGLYIPSLYYLDTKSTRIVLINSEITKTTCDKWFNLKNGDNVVNAYTGWEIKSSPVYAADIINFTPIYDMIYQMFNQTVVDGVAQKNILPICHEMPFTVITSDSLNNTTSGTKVDQRPISRSIDKNNKLVGSHLNQIDPSDTASLYWISRLMDWFNYTYNNCKLMLGGHKHTFTATYPVREYYFYGDGLNSKDNGPMEMTENLKNDSVNFMSTDNEGNPINLSKFPLTKCDNVGDKSGTTFYPYTPMPNLSNGIIYFMCQATGYKLTSNKELPSTNQKFSQILPGLNGSKSANTQKYPMFATIYISDNYDIKLFAVQNIMITNVGDTPVFNMQRYSTKPINIAVYDHSKDWITLGGNANDHMECWQDYNSNKEHITLTV